MNFKKILSDVFWMTVGGMVGGYIFQCHKDNIINNYEMIKYEQLHNHK
jgi:hypothetical protein